MKNTLKLYKSGGFAEEFQLIRLWDAPFKQLEKYIPSKGVVVDLGCGDGLLANYIALTRPNTKVFGIDINKARIDLADKGLKNTSFLKGNILNVKTPKADVVFIMHVLHHLSSVKAQNRLLSDVKSKLKSGGTVLIVEIDRRPFLKYVFSWLTDTITVPILFEKKTINLKVFYRTSEEWKLALEKLGFNTQVVVSHQGMPFSHVIIECTLNSK